MADLYGGHVVAKYLKEVEEVGAVFSLSGGHIDRIYDGFHEYGVNLIDVRHEQAAAMMAHAWSIYNGSPGVCLVTAGPGFTNTLTTTSPSAPAVCLAFRIRLRCPSCNAPMVGTNPIERRSDRQRKAVRCITWGDLIVFISFLPPPGSAIAFGSGKILNRTDQPSTP